MLSSDEKREIVESLLWMIEERVTAPLEKLLDCLVLELIAQNSVDTARLAERLESVWKTMPEHEREGCGQIYNRYRQLLGNPERLVAALGSLIPSGGNTGKRSRPTWLQDVVPGGRAEDDPNAR